MRSSSNCGTPAATPASPALPITEPAPFPPRAAPAPHAQPAAALPPPSTPSTLLQQMPSAPVARHAP
eukprot:6674676-Prymnesium_polylepis.1